jgi:aminopeptidase-like protein
METIEKKRPKRKQVSGNVALVESTVGNEMYKLIEALFPICRSITGNGVRQTLELVKKNIPIEIYEIPTATKVFDWDVPKEWNIKGASITDSSGKRIVDFANSNLHVLNYSIPIHKEVTLDELKQHLYTSTLHPDWIPYRTSYFKEDWGFCITHKQFQELRDDVYEVHIDSTLKNGYLTYGECYIPGELPDEILISSHICHPSLANDNLSGISLTTFLARELGDRKLRYSYRFLFIPGTIGAITWLAINERNIKRIKHGLVAALVGNEGPFIYKRSRLGNAEIDQVVEAALKSKSEDYEIINFSPYGYDERQFCSPGFNLPMGSLTRSRNDQYPEYHTSADNLEFIKPTALEDSLQMYREVIDMLEANHKYININPKCEPQLGRRGLYDLVGGQNGGKDFQLSMLWVLNLSDGSHSLLDICRQSGLKFKSIKQAAQVLFEYKLLIKI